jgi:hypothetical protein
MEAYEESFASSSQTYSAGTMNCANFVQDVLAAGGVYTLNEFLAPIALPGDEFSGGAALGAQVSTGP